MAYTYHGTQGLIPLPGRTVETYPSGLVRVEREYACRKVDEVRYRSQLTVGLRPPFDIESPAKDGLSIFPEVRQTSLDNGFIKFSVTAYGRRGEGTKTVVDRIYRDRITVGNFTGDVVLLEQNLIIETVLLQNQSLPSTTDSIRRFPVVIFSSGGGNVLFDSTEYVATLINYTSRNFGRFVEVVGTYAPYRTNSSELELD
jgi:hypothetical protein